MDLAWGDLLPEHAGVSPLLAEAGECVRGAGAVALARCRQAREPMT